MTKKYVTPDVRAVEIETSPLMASTGATGEKVNMKGFSKGASLDMECADDNE